MPGGVALFALPSARHCRVEMRGDDVPTLLGVGIFS